MRLGNVKQITIRYGFVGIAAASVHALSLFLMAKAWPLWFANLTGFAAASFASYLGHALFTFRQETKGKKFAIRWLILQYTINTALCVTLPILIVFFIGEHIAGKLVLIFTPTLVNALIWFQAAKFSSNRQALGKLSTVIHADDFGLTESINNAIVSLSKEQKLHSASILVNGTSVKQAISEWEKNKTIKLCLHLCLSEGMSISNSSKVNLLVDKHGRLKLSFINLLFLSFLSRNSTKKRLFKQQLKNEIIAQIKLYKELTGLESIYIDGHQHIHLIPIVLDILIELRDEYNIDWIRNTCEAIPPSLPINYWIEFFLENSITKWAVLQLLSAIAVKRIKHYKILTNCGFAGILFTGKMASPRLEISYIDLQRNIKKGGMTPPILLIHPSLNISQDRQSLDSAGFKYSKDFHSSRWREKEFDSIKNLKLISPSTF